MSKEYEELTIKVIDKRRAYEECRCNVCKKLIYRRSCLNSPELPKNNLCVEYWELTTGHNDWGTDSGDSIEHYDICSPECLQKEFAAYLDRSSEGINTEYFEVEHTRIACNQRGE